MQALCSLQAGREAFHRRHHGHVTAPLGQGLPGPGLGLAAGTGLQQRADDPAQLRAPLGRLFPCDGRGQQGADSLLGFGRGTNRRLGAVP